MDIRESLRKIHSMSDAVIQKLGPLSGIKFGYNRESVEWVDGYIERHRMRDDFDPNNINGLVNTIGAFIGECLVAQTNGAWAW